MAQNVVSNKSVSSSEKLRLKKAWEIILNKLSGDDLQALLNHVEIDGTLEKYRLITGARYKIKEPLVEEPLVKENKSIK